MGFFKQDIYKFFGYANQTFCFTFDFNDHFSLSFIPFYPILIVYLMLFLLQALNEFIDLANFSRWYSKILTEECRKNERKKASWIYQSIWTVRFASSFTVVVRHQASWKDTIPCWIWYWTAQQRHCGTLTILTSWVKTPVCWDSPFAEEHQWCWYALKMEWRQSLIPSYRADVDFSATIHSYTFKNNFSIAYQSVLEFSCRRSWLAWWRHKVLRCVMSWYAYLFLSLLLEFNSYISRECNFPLYQAFSFIDKYTTDGLLLNVLMLYILGKKWDLDYK